MVKSENKHRLIPVRLTAFLFLFVCYSNVLSAGESSGHNMELQTVIADEIVSPNLTTEKPGGPSGDELCTLRAISRYLAENINYPQEAVESGLAGQVKLYARVNQDGVINEVHEIKSVRDVVDIDPVTISGVKPSGIELIESSKHESLIWESRRVILSMPRLDIPEVYDEVLTITLNFVLK